MWLCSSKTLFTKRRVCHVGLPGLTAPFLTSSSKVASEGFPGGAVVESTCQGKRRGFDPWSGRIPHALGQLSLCATTPEPVPYSPGAAAMKSACPRAQAPWQEKPPPWEAHALQLERSPRLPQLENSQSCNKDPAQPKINKIISKRYSGFGVKHSLCD